MCSKTNDAAFCEWPCVCFLRASSLNNMAECCALQTRPQVHTEALNTHCVLMLCKAVIFSFMLSSTHTHAEYQQGGWVWLPSLSFMWRTVPWLSKSHGHMCGSHKTTTVTAWCTQERHGTAGQKRFKKRWQEPKRDVFLWVMCRVSPSLTVPRHLSVLQNTNESQHTGLLWYSLRVKAVHLQPALFSECSTFFFFPSSTSTAPCFHLPVFMFLCVFLSLLPQVPRLKLSACLDTLLFLCTLFLVPLPVSFFCIHLTGQSLSALLSFFGLCGPPHKRFSDVRLHVVMSYTLVGVGALFLLCAVVLLSNTTVCLLTGRLT